MKSTIKLLAFTALAALIGFSFISCGDGAGNGITDEPTALSGSVSIPLFIQVNKAVNVDTSNLGGAGIISYEWKLNDITVGTASSYKPIADDEGESLKVVVTRKDNTGSVVSNSSKVWSKDVTPPTVEDVTVSPSAASVERGAARKFTADVIISGFEHSDFKTVTWSVTPKNAGTSINQDGRLTVAANESANKLTVRATSNFDDSKYGEAAVTVTGAITTPISFDGTWVYSSGPSSDKGAVGNWELIISGNNWTKKASSENEVRGTFTYTDTQITVVVKDIWVGGSWQPIPGEPLEVTIGFILDGNNLYLSDNPFEDFVGMNGTWTKGGSGSGTFFIRFNGLTPTQVNSDFRTNGVQIFLAPRNTIYSMADIIKLRENEFAGRNTIQYPDESKDSFGSDWYGFYLWKPFVGTEYIAPAGKYDIIAIYHTDKNHDDPAKFSYALVYNDRQLNVNVPNGIAFNSYNYQLGPKDGLTGKWWEGTYWGDDLMYISIFGDISVYNYNGSMGMAADITILDGGSIGGIVTGEYKIIYYGGSKFGIVGRTDSDTFISVGRDGIGEIYYQGNDQGFYFSPALDPWEFPGYPNVPGGGWCGQMYN